MYPTQNWGLPRGLETRLEKWDTGMIATTDAMTDFISDWCLCTYSKGKTDVKMINILFEQCAK